MNMKATTTRTLLFAIALLLPLSAQAHAGPGGHAGFALGLMHPLTGLDHLLAMLAVGLWAAQMPRYSLPRILAYTATALLIGAMTGLAGIGLPMVEAGLALSVVLFGALVVAGSRLPFNVAISLVALFAVLHGHAHGSELPAHASGYAFVAGFLLASLTLMAGACVTARCTAPSRRLALPLGGFAIALLGISMVLAV
jgi:urease accessory protein